MNADEAREHAANLESWRDLYVQYLQRGDGESRRAVLRSIPAAQEAMNAAEADLIVTDPPALGAARQHYSGLANIAFLHERPGFGIDGGPQVYEGLLDVIENAVATLERDAEQAERTEPRPTYCDRGHLISMTVDATTPFCGICGALAINHCPNCEAPIRAGEPPEVPPQFCASCGAAFPWVNREGRIHQLQNLLSREELDEPTTLQVRHELDALIDPDLSEEEQAERWGKIKRLAPGLARSGQSIVEGLVSAWVRQQAGL